MFNLKKKPQCMTKSFPTPILCHSPPHISMKNNKCFVHTTTVGQSHFHKEQEMTGLDY